MSLWILFVILYGLFKGMREPIKKKALEKNSLLPVLFVYTLIGFILVMPSARDIFYVPYDVLLLIMLKSSVIFIAWILTFISVKKLPVSLYGVFDMSRVLFSTLLGVFFLNETLTPRGILSLILVLLGLYLVNCRKESRELTNSNKYIWFTIGSCALNGISGTLDKYIMSLGTITSSQLQFWFMLILTVMYLLYMLLKREKFEIKSCIKNPYVYLLSILLVAGDKLLFIANSDPESKVTIMILIKQCSVIVTVLAGKFIYKEKHILYKLMCTGIIIFGILLAAI